jgi:hypothetical protein
VSLYRLRKRFGRIKSPSDYANGCDVISLFEGLAEWGQTRFRAGIGAPFEIRKNRFYPLEGRSIFTRSIFKIRAMDRKTGVHRHILKATNRKRKKHLDPFSRGVLFEQIAFGFLPFPVRKSDNGYSVN